MYLGKVGTPTKVYDESILMQLSCELSSHASHGLVITYL